VRGSGGGEEEGGRGTLPERRRRWRQRGAALLRLLCAARRAAPLYWRRSREGLLWRRGRGRRGGGDGGFRRAPVAPPAPPAAGCSRSGQRQSGPFPPLLLPVVEYGRRPFTFRPHRLSQRVLRSRPTGADPTDERSSTTTRVVFLFFLLLSPLPSLHPQHTHPHQGWPLYLSTKNTILKTYDGAFMRIFAETYEGPKKYAEKFRVRFLWNKKRRGVIGQPATSPPRLAGGGGTESARPRNPTHTLSKHTHTHTPFKKKKKKKTGQGHLV
jgi:hypothetical protein